MGKNLPVMQEILVLSLGQEYHLEEEMATHFSILAWEILWTEEPGLQSTGSQISEATKHFHFSSLEQTWTPSLAKVQENPSRESTFGSVLGNQV